MMYYVFYGADLIFEGSVDVVEEFIRKTDDFWVRKLVVQKEGIDVDVPASEFLEERDKEAVKRVENHFRRIVREELKSLVKSLGDTACKLDGQESSDAESSALAAIYEVMKAEIDTLPHSWGCPKRKSYYEKCSCGVDNEEKA